MNYGQALVYDQTQQNLILRRNVPVMVAGSSC